MSTPSNHKPVLIATGIFVVLAGLAGWALLLFVMIHNGGLSSGGMSGEASAFTVRFGIIEVDSLRHPYFSKETTTIPLKLKDTGFEYGIEIIPPDEKPFTYQMVFHFSAAPKVITGNGFESSDPSDTMKTASSPAQGIIFDQYWFDDGDPMGDQSVDVYINGQFVKTIKYSVVAPDAGNGT